MSIWQIIYLKKKTENRLPSSSCVLFLFCVFFYIYFVVQCRTSSFLTMQTLRCVFTQKKRTNKTIYTNGRKMKTNNAERFESANFVCTFFFGCANSICSVSWSINLLWMRVEKCSFDQSARRSEYGTQVGNWIIVKRLTAVKLYRAHIIYICINKVANDQTQDDAILPIVRQFCSVRMLWMS